MEPGGHRQFHHPYLNVTQDLGVVSSGERDRLPQWSHGETKEFLAMRWELDRSFMETKRNKMLWELISAKMKDKGFHRTPDQCKCKWKNLVTRYKGSEAMEAETIRQFPFQDVMRRIFSDRMKRFLTVDEGRKGRQQLQVWSVEEEEDALLNKEQQTKKKRKAVAASGTDGSTSTSGSSSREELVKNALRGFMRSQMQIEAQWLQAAEAREVERRAMEMEWRRAMETIAAERAMMERRWREKEDERRGREEERAERRHQLIVGLLAKLTNDGV